MFVVCWLSIKKNYVSLLLLFFQRLAWILPYFIAIKFASNEFSNTTCPCSIQSFHVTYQKQPAIVFILVKCLFLCVEREMNSGVWGLTKYKISSSYTCLYADEQVYARASVIFLWDSSLCKESCVYMHEWVCARVYLCVCVALCGFFSGSWVGKENWWFSLSVFTSFPSF